jgi:predicted O-methyltransferase YrrM
MVGEMFVDGTAVLFLDAQALLEKLLPGTNLSGVADEFGEVAAELRHGTSNGLPYGGSYAVGAKTSFLLYALVRSTKPAHVWETGVADGVSSFVILSAMERNGSGTLHSTDINPDVGILVPNGRRDRWDLHLLDRRALRHALRAYATQLPPLDLFVHDSRHTFAWQALELAVAADLVKPSGYVASDDVDASFAFADFCRSRRLTPLLLLDGYKFFGIAAARSQ